ncbi:MAG: CBS domain-containing protein [Halobacteriales archaeon]
MDDIFVARLMTSPVETVDSDTLVEDAANLMLDEDIGSVVVIDGDGALAGILTSTDFVRIVAERKPKDQTPVSEYMTTDVETVGAQDLVEAAADRMIQGGFHHAPVVDDEEGVVGILSTTDLTAYLSDVQDPSP